MKNLIGLTFLIFTLASCQHPQEKTKSIWTPYTKQALADSINHNKPVVIDFYADYCPHCHELDRTVFSDPLIVSKLSFVTALRVDVTNMDDAHAQNIAREYGVDGLPTVIFLDSHGHEIANSRLTGPVSSKEFSQSLVLLAVFI